MRAKFNAKSTALWVKFLHNFIKVPSILPATWALKVNQMSGDIYIRYIGIRGKYRRVSSNFGTKSNFKSERLSLNFTHIFIDDICGIKLQGEKLLYVVYDD